MYYYLVLIPNIDLRKKKGVKGRVMIIKTNGDFQHTNFKNEKLFIMWHSYIFHYYKEYAKVHKSVCVQCVESEIQSRDKYFLFFSGCKAF